MVEVRCNSSIDAALAEMAATDPDLDPVWGLLGPCAGEELNSHKNCEQAGAAMATADSDVDPIRALMNSGCPQITAALWSPESLYGHVEESWEDSSEHEKEYAAAASTPSSPSRPREKTPISNVVDKAEVLPGFFTLPDVVAHPTTTRRNVEGCDAFVLDGVLSVEECAAIIAQGDGLWSFWDDSERPRVSFRNAHTIEVTHQELADRIWSRVAHLVTPSLSFSEEDGRFEVDIEGAWAPFAMNPKLLLSRYLDGGHFSPHTDGTTVVDFNRRTFYSCVLFLNESPWGGHTRLYADAQIGRELRKDGEGRLTGEPELVLEAVAPAPGRMLVFYHRLMHEGVPAAEKYIIRTDVLYRREPERCTAPEDREAFGMYQEAQLRAERGECDAAAELFCRAFKRSPALRAVYRC